VHSPKIIAAASSNLVFEGFSKTRLFSLTFRY